MSIRDATEVLEELLPTLQTMETTFEKVAAIRNTQASGNATVTDSGQTTKSQSGSEFAKKNAEIINDFRSNVVMPALQQSLSNKAAPSTPGLGMGSSSNSGRRQGQ